MSEERDNPPDIAVALQYDGERAPRVTARGHGELAARIVEIAREHDIPLQENPVLIQALAQVELGEEIPPALYLAVAEIIAFAYHLSGKTPHS
ncbi:MAG TPA: hypothetical protein ENJ05_10555 [Thiotrichales bacterium]|nr:hypothetical protein [Thiotrichales bacterium]